MYVQCVYFSALSTLLNTILKHFDLVSDLWTLHSDEEMETAFRELRRMLESGTVTAFLISFPSGTDVWMWPVFMFENNDAYIVQMSYGYCCKEVIFPYLSL